MVLVKLKIFGRYGDKKLNGIFEIIYILDIIIY